MIALWPCFQRSVLLLSFPFFLLLEILHSTHLMFSDIDQMPYPENLLPEAEVINLSDEEDDYEDASMVILTLDFKEVLVFV